MTNRWSFTPRRKPRFMPTSQREPRLKAAKFTLDKGHYISVSRCIAMPTLTSLCLFVVAAFAVCICAWLIATRKLQVCKTDGIKKCKAGSISLRLFKLKQIEVNNGQKTIDIRPRTRYNISNLIRKQCYHYCIAK